MSYEDLSGAVGRSVFYRPPRFRARALVGTQIAVVRVGDLQGRLLNASMSGVACRLQASSPGLAVGDHVPVEIWLETQRAFSARGEIARWDPLSREVAVRFVDELLNPSELARLSQDLRFRDAVRAGISAFDGVPSEYRLALAEVVTVLTHWRRLIDQREAAILADAQNAKDELAALEELAEKRLRQDWMRARSRASELADKFFFDIDDSDLAPAKRLTETIVTPHLLVAAIWHRAFTKPLGYPGDYVLMNYMYDESRLGETVFARIMHQLGREERLASTVRTRKDLLVRALRNEAHRCRSAGRELRVTNIGAGPAQEVVEFLGCDLPCPVHVSLIDQDHDALSHAHEQVKRASLRHGSLVGLSCRHVSFRQLLNDPILLGEIQAQDLIYSAGLFDYLPDHIASSLLVHLFQLLAPGASLLVGNAAKGPGIRWVPEFVLDWRMIYRTEEDMRQLVASLPGSAPEVSVQADDSGAWNFLRIRKRR